MSKTITKPIRLLDLIASKKGGISIGDGISLGLSDAIVFPSVESLAKAMTDMYHMDYIAARIFDRVDRREVK